MKTERGFTLIELLVVITIIAILASIGMTIYSGAQKQARIAKRVGDLKAIQTALELYYNTNNEYPTIGAAMTWRGECSGYGSYTSDQVIPGLVPTYMVAFPADPSMKISSSNTSCYLYNSDADGTDYKLLDFQISEFTSANYQSQRNLIDPRRDGGTDNCKVDGDGTGIFSWAVWSSDTSACW